MKYKKLLFIMFAFILLTAATRYSYWKIDNGSLTPVEPGQPITIQGSTDKTENIITFTDSAGDTVAFIKSGGKIQSEVGFRATANDWGDSFAGWGYGDYVAEHTVKATGNYDATGNANGEAYFYDTTNSPFEQEDEDFSNWIILTSGDFQGAKARITRYVSADGVTIHQHGTSWDEDLSGVSYKIFKAPTMLTSSANGSYFFVGVDGEFHVGNSGGPYVGDESMVEISDTAGVNGADAIHIHVDADGYNNVDAMQIFYHTGDVQAADDIQVVQISVDESNATGGEIDLLLLETTEASAIDKHAIHVGVGFDTALKVSGADALSPEYGYEYTAGAAPVDRVNSAGGGNDAFTNAAVDVTIFDLNNDIILIGSENTFEVLSVYLATPASKNMELEFYYSNNTNGTDTGVPGWTRFYPDDATQGFQNTGLIDWDSPGADWDKDDLAEAGQAITNAYYIAIKRKYAYNPVEPIEDYFQIYASKTTGMNIRGDGVLTLPYLGTAPANLANGMIWMESDGLHVYYGGGEQILAP